jgi:VWFA-related protein
LHRFLFDLLDPQDEVFLYRFDSRPDLVRGWTTDRASLGQALGAIKPFGGTAIYDTLAEAVPLTATGTRRKKALVLVSDGQDTSSHTTLAAIRQLIRESEVLVYAVGIDADGASPSPSSSGTKSTRSSGAPVPSPFPGRPPVVSTPTPSSSQSARGARSGSSDRVNADALREITDDSGGRTEVIRSHRDLDPATASIADELRRQYFLGYASTIPKDGRWHTIEVQLVHQKVTYRIRSRRGFVAS